MRCLNNSFYTVAYCTLFDELLRTALRGNNSLFQLELHGLFILFLGVNVRKSMADYETGLRLAIKNKFPAARLSRCWFQFARAVHRKGKYYVTQGFKVKNGTLTCLP